MFPIRDLAPTRIFPYVTVAVIVANVIAFFGWQPLTEPDAQVPFLYERAAIACELTTGEPLSLAEIATGRCAEAPTGAQVFPSKQIWLSVIVSLFLHGGLLHIAGNMWFLWIFGNNVEEAFTAIGFAALYILGGIVATVVFVAVHPASTDPLIGASGAVAAVLGAYFVLFPRHWVVALVVFFAMPVPAVLFLGLWFLGQFVIEDPGVAWEAHVAGFAFGMAVTLPFRSALVDRVRRIHFGPRMRV